jgi:hypothetical protein
VSVVEGIAVTSREGDFEVSAYVAFIGEDLLVVVRGGVAHIGAVGMATPRPSLSDPVKRGATSSVFTFVGHKEDLVVKMLSEELSKIFNRKVVVVAGIHWDGLKKEEIRTVVGLCERLKDRIVEEVGSR